MAAAAVFCAFLAPFVALIAGLAFVTFSPLKRESRPKTLALVTLFVAGITALGWAAMLLSSSIGLWTQICVLAISSLYQALVILFVSTDMLSETSIDESPGNSLRPRKIV